MSNSTKTTEVIPTLKLTPGLYVLTKDRTFWTDTPHSNEGTGNFISDSNEWHSFYLQAGDHVLITGRTVGPPKDRTAKMWEVLYKEKIAWCIIFDEETGFLKKIE
jgi:hypothetical protein